MSVIAKQSPSSRLFNPFLEINEFVCFRDLWFPLLAEIVETLIDSNSSEPIRWITRCFQAPGVMQHSLNLERERDFKERQRESIKVRTYIIDANWQSFKKKLQSIDTLTSELLTLRRI